MKKANCREADKSLFILEKGHSGDKAKKICAKCIVREPCYEYGVKTGSVGVWGGRILTFRNEDPIELYPISNVRDFRAEPIQSHERKRIPSILGGSLAASFRKIPSILGTQGQRSA